MQVIQGCSWVQCCLCGVETLMADVMGSGHPDEPPSVICQRCADTHTQSEIEHKLGHPLDGVPDDLFCWDCGAITPDGSEWCETCAAHDLAYEGWMFDGSVD